MNEFYEEEAPAITFKLIVLGDTGVGKTSLVVRGVKGEFVQHSATIGASFMVKHYEIQGRKVSVRIWDTAGQERFRSMAQLYYRGCDGALVVFDLLDQSTFGNVQDWFDELKKHEDVDSDIVLGCVGNKSDLVSDQNEIAGISCFEASDFLEDCDKYAKSQNAMFVLTSARSGKNVDKLFQGIATRLLERYLQKEKEKEEIEEEVSLQENLPQEPGCC